MADGDKDPADEPDTSATPDEPDNDASDSDDRELVPAGRVSRSDESSSDDADAGGAKRGRSKKDKATPKQKRDTVEHKRTGPVTFVKQSVGELRKVVYPTGPQLANYFVVVLIFVLFIIAYVSLLDLGIGAAIFRIFA